MKIATPIAAGIPSNSVKMTAGTAPINGPKYGIILKRPTIKESSSAYGFFMIERTMKQMIPIIKESNDLPTKNLIIVVCDSDAILIILFAVFCLNSA